ncbi:NADH-quinone oxidoreductase subunit NuoG [Pseudomonadota bacterium]
MVNIEIDGKNIVAKDGAMIIEAADEAGIEIPRFCYHKKLSVAANCRMCLVEVEKAAKPLPACATPVTDGMKVLTRSHKAVEAQKSVMEFLLINHPLDCPICDQGGECDLQDLAVGYGSSHSQYTEQKRVIKDKNIGPLISTDMTRCIHCTRCVRFGQEIAGVRELGATGRGEHMQIGTYIEKAVSSELSGNVIDLCPVGALTSKPFRFNARSWEMNQRSSVAAHDCVGSNIKIESLRGEVRRVTPIENDSINEAWISDRDRFSYEGVNSEDRLATPMIKRDGEWEESDWQAALEFAVAGLKKVLEKHGAGQLGALTSANSTLEEMFLLQKLVRGLGSSNVDHRLQQQDFSDQDSMPLYLSLGQRIVDLENLNAALLVGSNLRQEQPMINHRIRKAALKGAKVMAINPVDYDFNYDLSAKTAASPAGMELAIAGVAKALIDGGATAPKGLAELVASVSVTDADRQMAEALKSGSKSTVLIGSYGMSCPASANLRSLAAAVAKMSGATFGYLTAGANSAGGYLAGALPHRAAAGKGATFGLNAQNMWEEKLAGYVLQGVEPEFDCANPEAAIKALKNAEFVVSLSAYKSGALSDCADVMLPIAPFTETSGTFVNIEGNWQSFQGAIKPLGETRPAWKVLRVLGNLFNLDGFDYISSEEVRDELQAQIVKESEAKGELACPKALSNAGAGLVRVADVGAYAVDAVTRRASSLQQTVLSNTAVARINASLATSLGLGDAVKVEVSQGSSKCVVALEVDERAADGTVWLSTGSAETSGFGVNGAEVSLKPV